MAGASSQEQALLAGVIAAPEDDAPRLVYADWLEEHGGERDLARATFIRLHLDWCRRPPDAPPDDALRERLLTAWRDTGLDDDGHVYDRGFVSCAGFEDLGKLCRRGEEVFAAAPCRLLLMGYFFDCEEWSDASEGGRDVRAELLSLAPRLQTVIGFGGGMRRSGAYGDSLAALLDLPQFAGLQLIHFPEGDSIGDRVAGLIAARPHLANLRVIDLTECELSDEGLAALAEAPHLASLRSLRIDCGAGDGDLTDEGVAALVRSPHLSRLEQLELGGCEGVTDRGLRRLLRWPGAEGLTYLDVGCTDVTADGVLALCRCRKLGNLRQLNLSEAPDAVVEALLTSRHLKSLRRIGLDDEGEGLSAEGRRRLEERFGPLALGWDGLPPPICEADRIARRAYSQDTGWLEERGPEWRVL